MNKSDKDGGDIYGFSDDEEVSAAICQLIWLWRMRYIWRRGSREVLEGYGKSLSGSKKNRKKTREEEEHRRMGSDQELLKEIFWWSKKNLKGEKKINFL